jgi:hypothetical protein
MFLSLKSKRDCLLGLSSIFSLSLAPCGVRVLPTSLNVQFSIAVEFRDFHIVGVNWTFDGANGA